MLARCRTISEWAVTLDAVITWVDGSDPEHIAKRHQTASRLGISVHDPGAASTRFASRGELQWTIPLLRKFAPFVETIFLVTDDQTPVWLDLTAQREMGVRIVDHTEIFLGWERYLPSFNSLAIESQIHKIAGLSNDFLYLNDDFFIIRYLDDCTFYRDVRPIVRGHHFDGTILGRARRKLSRARRPEPRGLVGKTSGPEINSMPRHVRLAHAPHLLKKSWFHQYFSAERNEEQFVRDQFRTSQSRWIISHLANWALSERRASLGQVDWAYLSPDDRYNVELGDSDGAELSISDECRFLCVQSMDHLPEAVICTVSDYLHQVLESE